MSQSNRKLAAVVAADVVGYSRLMGHDEMATLAALRTFRKEQFEPRIDAHHGDIVKRMGDGWLVEFSSVYEAVNCALEIQRALADDPVVTLRIGIHVGDIVHEDEDIFGDGVNIAARLQEIAAPGAIAMSAVAHTNLDSKLSAQFQNDGQFSLKNINDPVEVYFWGGRSDAASHMFVRSLQGRPTVAVLPFRDLSPGEDARHMAESIAAEIIDVLASSQELVVISRDSSFQIRGEGVNHTDAGRLLGVRYLLEGEVQLDGQQVRVSVRLADVDQGIIAWSDRYHGDLRDVFALQDDIASRVGGTISPAILIRDGARALRKAPDDLTYWDLVRRANWHAWQSTEADLLKAYQYFTSAIERRPDKAYPYAHRAYVSMGALWLGWQDDPEPYFAAALADARRSVELDRNNSASHLALGSLLGLSGDPSRALSVLERAADLSPNNAEVLWILSIMLCAVDRLSEAEHAVKTAMVLNPISPHRWVYLCSNAWYLCLRGEGAAAVPLAEKGFAEEPTHWLPAIYFAYACAVAGKEDSAAEAIRQSIALEPRLTGSWFAKRHWRLADNAMVTSIIDACCAVGLPE